MNPLLALLVLGCLALGVGIVLLVRAIASPGARLPVTAGWIDELSGERYRPMMRLLESEDIDFLRSQPGFSSRMASRLRAQRCKIFRGYLRCLNTDFKRIMLALKLVMMQSLDDRPDLAAILFRQQLSFAFGLTLANVRVVLYRFGGSGVDVGPLVRIFDTMRQELQAMVPITVGTEA
jgi:hypothetical protein